MLSWVAFVLFFCFLFFRWDGVEPKLHVAERVGRERERARSDRWEALQVPSYRSPTRDRGVESGGLGEERGRGPGKQNGRRSNLKLWSGVGVHGHSLQLEVSGVMAREPSRNWDPGWLAARLGSTVKLPSQAIVPGELHAVLAGLQPACILGVGRRPGPGRGPLFFPWRSQISQAGALRIDQLSVRGPVGKWGPAGIRP